MNQSKLECVYVWEQKHGEQELEAPMTGDQSCLTSLGFSMREKNQISSHVEATGISVGPKLGTHIKELNLYVCKCTYICMCVMHTYKILYTLSANYLYLLHKFSYDWVLPKTY